LSQAIDAMCNWLRFRTSPTSSQWTLSTPSPVDRIRAVVEQVVEQVVVREVVLQVAAAAAGALVVVEHSSGFA